MYLCKVVSCVMDRKREFLARFGNTMDFTGVASNDEIYKTSDNYGSIDGEVDSNATSSRPQQNA